MRIPSKASRRTKSTDPRELRKLRADVTAAFPALGTDQASELVPAKEELSIVKLYAHRGDAVTVYVSGGNPVLFELEKNLYPTVYTLWSYPDLLPAFTTWPLVLEKLVGGADLMLPGIVVPPAGLPQVQKGDLCAIVLVGNRAPVAIGVAAMSTSEMLTSGLKGRGFSVLHTYEDHLWRSGDKSSPPFIAPLTLDSPDVSEEKGSVQAGPALQDDMRRLTLEGKEEENGEDQQMRGEKTLPEASEDPGVGGLNPNPADSKTLQEQMDELLQQCFLHALKCRIKKTDLPLLTSTFLGSHVFSCCPEGRQLDIKKSSYKKLSKFLQQMQQEQIIQVKELSKGVESIVAVDWKHPRITSFVIPEPSPTSQTIQEGSREQPYHPPDIKPLYCVPASMSLLFQESGHKKGSILEGGEVRMIIINYAKKNDLVDADNKNLVHLDPILCDCILEKSEQHTVMKLPWDSLLTRCLEKLQPAYQVTFPGQEPIVKKGKICPIDITLAQRASNKKVTVVRNLEAYGLDPCTVAATLQQRCQASTTVAPAPGAKDSLQVQIQGNQVHHLGRLLLEEYQLPRKHIQGLEKAPKPGKKK
ncbi:eukaryotic translation initiation factor 2D isoform X2 [Myotis daubentonii]|uniref:eukaryotic translation initiation factor 2D isoform X2 n=1 Tax=Myotis daubentonii TaxID=98922 RepID=UPI002872BA8B|nr:eukaryotic translation initiation factor 2D isoform X2 [Myotis daubentonii]XP_059529916.1 eukaryotic translation initiation factor 2D isoform X2 [Myotis daubentonii]XP_059529917.1 eukaryotic translation initiation factor 2D isoform X2 [Myotis daubentonii]